MINEQHQQENFYENLFEQDDINTTTRKYTINGTLYFSVVDIIRSVADLPDRKTAKRYWMNIKDAMEKIDPSFSHYYYRVEDLTIPGSDEFTDNKYTNKVEVATVDGCFRIIMEVSSPKAESIRQFLIENTIKLMNKNPTDEKKINDVENNKPTTETVIEEDVDDEDFLTINDSYMYDEFSKHGVSNEEQQVRLQELNHIMWSLSECNIPEDVSSEHVDNLNVALETLSEALTCSFLDINKSKNIDEVKDSCCKSGLTTLYIKRLIENTLSEEINRHSSK